MRGEKGGQGKEELGPVEGRHDRDSEAGVVLPSMRNPLSCVICGALVCVPPKLITACLILH